MEIRQHWATWREWDGITGVLVPRALAAMAALTACCAPVALSGCQSVPGSTGQWSAVNTLNGIEAVRQAGTSRPVPAPVSPLASTPASLPILSLRQAIDQLVPAAYRIDIADDLDLDMRIKIDNSKNWMEALGQGLSDANIEFIANLYIKSATIRWNKIALQHAIKMYLPEDFTVYADARVNLQALIRFDPRQYWAQALSLGASDNNIDLAINYKNKSISLSAAHSPDSSTADSAYRLQVNRGRSGSRSADSSAAFSNLSY